MKIQEIPINLIKDNPYQTRETIEKEPLQTLTKSIRERGLFSPISLLKENGGYIVISGHRRLMAFKKLKRKTIPAIVKPRKNGNELIIDLCHENLIREDLTPIEKALSIRLLISQIKNTKNDLDKMITLVGILKNYKRRGYVPEHRREQTKDFIDDDVYKLDKVLKSINVSENNATTYLSILGLPREIKRALCFNQKGREFSEKISIKKAEQLARIKDLDYQMYVFERACDKTTAKHIQALADMYIKKVNSGEWKGYAKQDKNYFAKFKDDLKKLGELSEYSERFSAKLSSFKVDTLLKLEATIEKQLFISSMVNLKRELDTLGNLINEKLRNKGYSKIRKNIDTFEVVIHPCKEKDMMRFTFPSKIKKELNLPKNRTTGITLKVIGIKNLNKQKIRLKGGNENGNKTDKGIA